MYATLAIVGQPIVAKASPTAAGPSSSRLIASTGTGTTSADQTTMPKPFAPAAEREITLPMPQLRPAATQTSIGTIGAESGCALESPERDDAEADDAPAPRPRAACAVGRSRSTTAPRARVKIIWHCSTTAASPAGRPRCIAVKSSPNWPALMNSPMPTMTRHGASGLRHEEDERHGDQREAERDEHERERVAETEVDHHEVHAPDDRHEQAEQRDVGESRSRLAPDRCSTSSESLP